MCVGSHIQSKGRFQKSSIINAGQIPGFVINRHALTRDGINNFEDLLEKPDRPVFINAAATLHHKQALNIVDFWNGLADGLTGKALF